MILLPPLIFHFWIICFSFENPPTAKGILVFRLAAVVAAKNRFISVSLSFLVEAFSVVQSMGYGVAICRKFSWGLILGFRLFRHVALSPQQFSFRQIFPPCEKLNALAEKTK